MFKIESYITPILLSYVDKYIKNFRLEDSTVSLWGGDACFHNLDLRLEVLEQELHLPVSFVSGHIRELLIHVPWTKLASEPITITINTIECILKLKGSDSSSTSSSSKKSKERAKTGRDDLEAPPGYLSSLIHKIVGNIRIYCNNLILKYVEEDIVLSMNIKHFKFESANELWESSFTDLASDQVKIRKLICINDLTICLDKRNAAGKIEVYQEPMLYKCSMTMHLLRMYHASSASKSSTTRLDIYCNSLEFGMSEQQLPMLIRLILLLYALKKKKKENDYDSNTSSTIPTEAKDDSDPSNTWGGWAWSYVSSVLSETQNEDSLNQQALEAQGHIFQMGFYVDKATVIFKVTDASRDRNYYSHKKLRYMPVLALELQGIYLESVSQSPQWFNFTFGMSEILLSPLGYCSCAAMETADGCKPIPYLRIGNQANYYKFNSLFDADALENKGANKFYNTCWDYHLMTSTESVLLERTPAFAVDYIHEMAVTDDVTPESLSAFACNFEYSNLRERDYTRIFVAPLKLRVCSGLYHRLSSMVVAAVTYEYISYYTPTPDPDYQDLLPPSEEDYDSLTEFIPLASIKVTFFGPVIEFELSDHPHFIPKKGKLYRRHKKLSSHSQQVLHQVNQIESDNPKVVVEFQCLHLLYVTPFYVNRLVYTTCQLPDPPKALFEACYKKLELKVLGLTSRIILNPRCHTTILVPFNVSFMTRQILKPQYWSNPDVSHYEVTVESENLTLNGTKAKMIAMYNILMRLFELNEEEDNLWNSSLLSDASNDEGFPYMELYIEGIRFKRISTCSTVSLDMSLESVKAFMFETCVSGSITTIGKKNQYSNRNIQQVLFISGPEPKRDSTKETSILQDAPLFTATVQYPLNPDIQVHPTLLTFNLKEIRICVDPLVFKWFLYTPHHKSDIFANFADTPYKIKTSESSLLYEPSRKASVNLESIHSSSDREKSSVVSKKSKILKEEPIDIQERIYNFLRDWFNVWKCMIVSGEISQCTIYFPMESLSAVGSQGIQEAIDQAMNKKDPPDIMVITSPFLSTYCTQQQKLRKYITQLPVKLPQIIWSAERSCFPWTLSIKDISCFTIQRGQKMDCLKPCSINATIGLSTKNANTEQISVSGETPSSYSISGNDISSLGVCVHVDMTPVLISTCEIQVYLFASILYGLVEVIYSFMPSEKQKCRDYSQKTLESIDSRSGSSLMIPENSIELQSQHSSLAVPPEIVEQEAKLTAWLQWTITRFTIELNSMSQESKKNKPKLKLVIDTEDIVSSIDFQNVYLKIKSKVGSISVGHFKFVKEKWIPGPYLGLVMRYREDYLGEDRHEDNAFINLTITRASCRHTHTLWGMLHNRKGDPKAFSNSASMLPTRFITEIVLSIKPIDIVLPFKILRNYYLVLEPLFAIRWPKRKDTSNPSTTYINNQVLPLAYLDCHDIRVVVPVSCSKKKTTTKLQHDVFVFKISKISLTSNAVNPLCRTPYRPDIYQYAARNRILNIPGSEIEDRQYQLDISGISLNTGSWKNVELILNQPSGILTSLHGTSENPAVEWNNLEKVSVNSINPSMHLWPILEKIDMSFIAAPAMIYKEVLVCCNSVELNIISDIFINICLSQIKLVLQLFGEFNEFMQPAKTTKSKMKYPYSRLTDSHDESDIDILRDSGIESSELKSVTSSHQLDGIYKIENEKRSTYMKASVNADNVQPLELLMTGGKISFALYTTGDQYPIYEKRKFRKDNRSMDVIKDISGGNKGALFKIKFLPKLRFTKTKTGTSLKGKFSESSQRPEENASDEETEEKFIPLIFFSLSQPNIYFLAQKNNTKINISVFNISVKSGGSNFDPIISIPSEKDYQISVIETLAGMPHPDTGVPPAFLSVKVIRSGPNNTSLDIDFARPTKFYLSSSICFDLLAVLEEVSNCLQSDCFHNVPVSKTKISSSTLPLTLIPESGEYYIKFQEIKEKVFNVNNINLKTDQLVFIWATDQYKLRLTVGKLKNNFNLINRPDKVSNLLNLECVSLLYDSDNSSQLVLNPWSISLDILLFWESWQYLGDNPQVQIIAESDCLMVSLCPERIEIVYEVANDLLQFLSEFNGECQVENEEINSIEEEAIQSVLNSQDSEQYYKDDLRAGAFQFVDSTTNNVDEMPLPYQVMFWNKNIAAMAWRYPQPRCLTKIRVFPVPLKVAAEADHDIEIICSLEYWSDCQASFIPYAKFALPENEILHLDLPSGRPHAPFACVWRVELAMSETSDPNLDIFSTFSPKALAACMRIDSYFNRILISDLNVALSISKLNLTLHTSFNKDKCKILPKFLKDYTPDMMFPSSHCFSEINFDNLKLYGSSWKMDIFLMDMTSSFKLSVLDYAFLTMQPMIECSGFKLETSIANTCNCNFISKSLGVHFSPSIAHTLAVSMQLWNQNYLAFVSNNDEDLDFLVVTRYVISNDTNVALKFGQANTDEEVMLMPKHFNLYCWRSQKKKQELRVSIESKEWIWSESFSLKAGTQILDVDDKKKLTLNLKVVAVSATQYHVVFSGQLVITNMLMEHFELKVIQDSPNDNKKMINQIVAGNSTTTSMIINYEKSYFLRLRFYGLDTSWTGDIPLMEHSKSVQPWLVKVPLLEKGQFLSIWCRVVVQDFEIGKKILAMLWPLFSIKSNLPTNTKVHIETPTLNYSGELLVKGQGELQQLYCPGTIDHAHQLTFQLENVGLNPNPYVPMNYSLIDHQTFFKKMNKVDIQDILESLKASNEVKWPYFGDELDDIDWIIGEQPETHVQVKYQNACPYSSSLMVELLPWCLLVNTLGCTIAIKMEGMEVCTLRHNGIVAPPKMEGNFNICVYIDGEKFISDPLHFAKPATWSPNFYMPKILGIIPADGTIMSNVKCKNHICRLSIKSWVSNEIRLLKVGSTHIICNNTGFPLHVMCVAVPDIDTVYSIPHHSTSGFITIDPKIYNKNRGVSITQWFNIGRHLDQNGENDSLFYMLFSGDLSSGWSKPIRVDDVFTRKTVSIIADAEPIPLAITCYNHNGQNFISIQHDARPQVYIDNISGVTLFCAQAREGEESGAIEEAEHFTWFCEIKNGESNYYSMSSLTEKFPDIPVQPMPENLVFTKDPSGASWSLPVNITEDINQYVKIPFHGDVRIVLKNTSCLTYIRLESVSRVEINAKDIRSRLTEYEKLVSSNNSKSHYIKHNVEESKIMYSQSAEAISSYLENVDELNYNQFSVGDIRTRSDEQHPISSRLKRRKSDSQLILIRKMEKKLFCATIPMLKDWKSLTAKVYVNEFTFTLLSDIEIQSGDVNELAALACDNIAISLAQYESMEMNVYVQNMQLDNQLYSKKNFDFPVVMLLQEPKNCRKLRSLNVPIETLFEDSRANAVMELTLVIDTWKNQRQQKISGIQELTFLVQPISCYIEDTYLMLFSEYLHMFLPTSLVYIPEIPRIKGPLDQPTYVNVPDIVIWQTMVQSRPLTIRHLVIRPISVMLSIHSSMKVYLALDQSPLSFVEFDRKRMFTNAYRLGHTLTMHYLSGAIFRAGWVVSSLEILGSPVGLARAMGSGLKDFVALPFRGLLQGPVEFLYGVTHGSASLMRHVTAGTLQSVTKMASSMARNLDYLTLDEEHVKRAEELRRQRPSGVTEGLIQGLTGLGISILGAIGGIAHHPLQSVISEGGSPRSLAAGLGLGLVGIITKPLSGAAELLALTGQGLLQGAGWNNMPEQRNKPVLHNMFSSNSSILKYEWKFTSLNDCKVLHMSDATSICPGSEYTSVALIITNKNLVIMNVDDDVIQNVISLSQLECIKTNGDPTLLSFELVPLQTEVIRIDDDINIEMDPASRARVADYVKNTVGLIQVVNKSKEPSEMSISPLSSPGGRNDDNLESNTVLSFYVNSQDRNYFLCLLSIAKHENLDCSNNYPVL